MSIRFSLLLSCLTLAACNGNTWNYPPGTSCDPVNFVGGIQNTKSQLPASAHKLTVPDQSAESLPATHASLPDMPPGSYLFATADISYVSKPSKPNVEPIMVQLHDDLVTENNPANAMAMTCVREATVEYFTPEDLIVQAPTTMTVYSDHVNMIQRTFTFSMLSNRFQPKPTKVSGQTVSDISQIFTGEQKPLDWVVIANPTGGNPNDYELRADYACPSTMLPCTYTVSIHMNYFPPNQDIPPAFLPQLPPPVVPSKPFPGATKS